jgi:hypothetical protein
VAEPALLGDARMRGVEIAAQYYNFQKAWNDTQPEKFKMPRHLLVRNSMKRFQTLYVALALASAGTAYAQAPAAKEGPGNNAVNSDQKNSNAPVAGRNSFTEGQAQSAIEKAGYTNVTGLKKDDDGVWRGKASKNGSSSAVSVDFQGNVNAAK